MHLLLDIQSDEKIMELGLVPAMCSNADLGRWRRRGSGDTSHSNLILAHLFEFDIVKVGSHITAVVTGTLDFVDKLRRESSDSHRSSCASFLLAKNSVSTTFDSCNRVPQIFAAIKEILEAGIVSSSCISGAFDKVAGDQGTSKCVEVITAPTMPPGCSSDSGCGIRDSTAYYNIRSRPEGLCNP